MHQCSRLSRGTLCSRAGQSVSRKTFSIPVFFLLFLLLGCGSDGTPAGAVVGRAGRWDYTPSVIQNGNVERFWWCGSARNPAKPSQDTDTIQYEAINTVTGERVGPLTVLAETPGAWDSAYTCNPKVIQGSFTNPLGNGKGYSYAMYYVGTADVGGRANAIGVAFSNDGIHWDKYPSPVIPTTQQNGYGTGQPVPYNTDHKQAVTLFWEDASTPQQVHWIAFSADGVHFQNYAPITTNGVAQIATQLTWADMAFNPGDGYWYALWNRSWRNPSTTGGVPENGQVGFQLYRIPQYDLPIGAVGWQELATWDTNSSGYESNFLPGLLQDGYGNVAQTSDGTMHMFTSFSNKLVPWDLSPDDAAKEQTPTTWDIGETFWSAKMPTQYTLSRYLNGAIHRVTTGYVDGSVFKLEKTLGKVYRAPSGQANVGLYNCKTSAKYSYASLDPNCDGNYLVGLNGYIYAAPVAGTSLVPIYRCMDGEDRFVSSDPLCEGSEPDVLLGYIPPM